MHPGLFAAALGHGRDANVFLHLLGEAITLALFPKRHQKERREHRPRSWQGIEKGIIAMTLSPLGNGLIEALNRF
jgi:hypothetical protein